MGNTKREYKYGNDAREAIKTVAHHIGDTLGKTLGPAGRNFQIPEGITNDGRSILAHIRFPDECDDNIALAFHEVANRTDQDVGDGTTTATVIATELIRTVIDEVPDLDTPIPGKKNVMELSRQLEEEKTRAVELLSKKVKPVTDLETLEKVAFTSMEDREAAKVVAQTIFQAGPHSFTALEEGFSGKIETNVQAGIEMPLKVAAPFMYNRGREAVYEGNIPVLVVNHVFEEYRELQNFLTTMLQIKEASFPAIVIVAKQFSIPFVQAVARITQGSQGRVNMLLLSDPHFGDELFEDVAAFCDAKYLDTHPRGGRKISDIMFTHCGLVSKIVATPKGSVFYGGKGTQLNPTQETTRVQARIMQLRAELEKESSTDKRKTLERRIAEFSGGKATIYVDAKTAAEKYYVKLKVQDCMNSCKAALEGGMVRGGGIALLEVAEEMGNETLLYNALCSPYGRIQINAGGNLEIAEDVMDAFLVVKAGVENAVSVIKTAITIEGIIAEAPTPTIEEAIAHAVQNG